MRVSPEMNMMKLMGTAALSAILALPDASAQQAGNHAELVSVIYPNAMEAGGTYPVKVTFANKGSTTWTNGSKYDGTLFRLGATGDSMLWGLNRVDMTQSSVPPNAGEQSKYTFSFNVTAPANPTGKPVPQPFSWRMVQERVEWFGQTTPTTPHDQQILVTYAPPLSAATKTHWTTITPTYAPRAPSYGEMSLFNFANFRGANVVDRRYKPLNSHMNWFHGPADTLAMLDSARRMNLNMLRVPVIIPPATSAFVSSEWGWTDSRTAINTVVDKTRYFLDEAHKRGMKVIITLDGYTKYGYDDEPNKHCYWKKSFRDIEAHARILVAAIKDHPALFAWDLLNEPLHNAGQRWNGEGTASCLESAPNQADPNAYKSVVNAVHAMYNLVTEYDRAHFTTVGEGNVAYMKYWQDITSFVSFHYYYLLANNPATAADYQLVKDSMTGTVQMVSARSFYNDRPWPVVVSEFGGVKGYATIAGVQKQVDDYKNYLQALKALNVGTAFWDLSVNDEDFKIHFPAVDNGAAMECLIAGIQTLDNPNCAVVQR